MNVDQVIDSVGKAAAATKPTPEYCLFWIDHWSTCMTKPEWSGWMQAIFSVIAIVASAGFTWFQLWKSQRYLKQQAFNRFRAFADLTIGYFNAFCAAANPEISEVHLWRICLDELLLDARVLPIEHLESRQLKAFQAQRALLAQALEILRDEDRFAQRAESGANAPIHDPGGLLLRLNQLRQDFIKQDTHWRS